MSRTDRVAAGFRAFAEIETPPRSSLYPQLALHRSERSATESVAAAQAIQTGEPAASREAP